MKKEFWIIAAIVAGLLGFLGGYKTSASTGIEPRHFAEVVDSGGYGFSSEDIKGLDKASQDYYKNLLNEEQ